MGINNQRLLYADYVRVFATLAVILLHCAGDLLYKFELGNMNMVNWWTGNIFDSAVRWCVPIFVLLSGALLLRPSKPESIPDFLKKRMMKVVIPFAFWVLVYTTYTLRGHIENGTMPYWPHVFQKILFEDAYYHLWFVPMILGLYLFTPVFRVFVRHATRFEIEYFLVFWFYVSTLQIYFPHFIIIKFIGWLAYIGYLVLGDYLNTFQILEKDRKWIYRLGWLSLLITIGGTWQTSAYFGVFSDQLYQYLSPNVIFMAVAIFVWCKYYDWASFSARFPKINSFVAWYSKISFGVYLIHVLLIDIFKNGYLLGIKITAEIFFSQPITPIVGVPIFTFLIISLSTLLIYLMSFVPYLKKVIM